VTLWRISNYADLNGLGGLHASARWHSRGRPIVYLASTPSAALLEVIVHLELRDGNYPDSFQLLKAEAPDAVSRTQLPESEFAPEWSQDFRITRAAGDNWLKSAASALLEVPSVIVPETSNWLLNPLHPDAARLSVVWHRRFPYDGRLFRPRL